MLFSVCLFVCFQASLFWLFCLNVQMIILIFMNPVSGMLTLLDGGWGSFCALTLFMSFCLSFPNSFLSLFLIPSHSVSLSISVGAVTMQQQGEHPESKWVTDCALSVMFVQVRLRACVNSHSLYQVTVQWTSPRQLGDTACPRFPSLLWTRPSSLCQR